MDLRLHVLVDPQAVSVEAAAAFVQEVAAGGATVVQLRGKQATTRELLALGRALREATRRQGLWLWVNDRLDVALAVAADGVHMGQEDMDLETVRRLAPQLAVGLSVGDQSELNQALQLRPDYIGVGPVYATASKPDAGAPLGVEGFRILAARAHEGGLRVVAIGGIDGDNAGPVWRAGADGIAVIGAVMRAQDRTEACRRLLAAREPRPG